MTYIKINDTLYPATITGRLADSEWDNRATKSITLEMDYATAVTTFVDGLIWSIVQRDEVPAYNEHGEPIGDEIQETEYSNFEYNLAGDLTDHRDGRVTAKMGMLTDLEQAYELMLGGI